MNNLVTFNNNQLKVIESNNQRCLTATDIAKALGFEKVKSVSNIYTRHADEFDGLSWVINLMTETQSRHNRVFNREGAWLIGMFARTPKAAEFRKWVLKVLGTVVDSQPVPNDKTVMVSEHTRSLPSGKKEIVLSEKARTEIGGIVKACTATAIRDVLADRKPTIEGIDTVLRAQEALRQDERVHHYMLDDGEKMIIDTKRHEEKIGRLQILFALAADNCAKPKRKK